MNGHDPNRQVLCDIARSAFEVVSRLLSRDQLLARELRSSDTGSRQIYREECLTVEMAATLREQFSDHVEITLFTPHEEKRNGADWYWRFERGDHAIHARVQAKRVQRTDFDQADDLGHIDIDIQQLERLRRATNEAAIKIPGLEAWLATFARSDATPPCGFTDLQRCRHHRHQAACAEHGPSLWIAGLEELMVHLGRSGSAAERPSVRTIVQHSLRLDCLLPYIDGPSADRGPAKKGFTLAPGRGTYQGCVAIIEGDALLRKEFEGALRVTV